MIRKTRRYVLELESLEARELPSAQPLGPSLAWAPSPPAQVSVNLLIQGTQDQLSNLGLPSSMAGNIYLGSMPTGNVVGSYQETLTPIFVNGQFAGTTGVATFTFFISPWSKVLLETITTQDVSWIQGINPATGALSVASTGTVTHSAGLFPNLQGGFASASVVSLSPVFADTTQVHLTVQAPALSVANIFLSRWAATGFVDLTSLPRSS
jgi:hypothetical protein